MSGRKILFAENEHQYDWVQCDFAADHVVLTIRKDRRTHTIRCGLGAWQFGASAIYGRWRLKVAASAAWCAPDTCRIIVRFYETPFNHSLDIKFSYDGAVLEIKTNVSFGSKDPLILMGKFSDTQILLSMMR